MEMKGYVGCLIMAALMVEVAAETLIVGDTMGWTIPKDTNAYSTWASSKQFKSGDTLVFKWNETHNVAEVSKGDYDSCSKTPINNVTNAMSPVNITLTSNTTSRYFICTVGSHCNLGQKVAITMGSTDAGTASITTVSVISAIVLALSMCVSPLTYL